MFVQTDRKSTRRLVCLNVETKLCNQICKTSCLAQVDTFVQPVSNVVGAAIAGIGDAVSGERGEQLTKAGQTVADLGPELLRLSGLTKRD